MMRSLAALAWVVSLMLMGACVNVDKPTAVTACEKTDGGCTDHGHDGSAGPGPEVKPVQDGVVNSNADGAAVQDGLASLVPDGSAGGPSDRAPDLASGIVQDASIDVALDVAQDVVRDAATDLASGPCWSAG